MSPKVRKYLKKLKLDFPLRKPVKLRIVKKIVVDGHHWHGYVQDKGDHFRILLAKQEESNMVDWLMHEWTHALLWPRCTRNHTDMFWLTFGPIYRLYSDS